MVPRIVETTTEIGLKKAADGEVGSSPARAVSRGVGATGQDKEGKIGGAEDGGVGDAGEGDPPNPTNVEEGNFDSTTQRLKNTSPDSSSGESESSSDSDESSSDSNESAEELPLVPTKVAEVRNATHCFQRH